MQPDLQATETQIASSSDRGTKLTYEDYVALTPGDLCYELIEGELLLAPSPSVLHQVISQRVFMAMRQFVDERDLGEVFYAPLDVVLSDHNVVQPDIFFISKARLSVIKEAYIDGPPDLVVEVVSPGSAQHDLVTKHRLYDQFGVHEYWVVDPAAKSVSQFVNVGDVLQSVGSHSENDVIRAQVLAGFSLELAALFAR